MSITTAIVHDHRGRAKDGKPAMLEIRVTLNRRHRFVSTGIKVRKSEFVAGSVCNRLDASVLNERLIIINNKVCAAVNEAIRNGEDFDVADIRQKVLEVREEQEGVQTFLEWVHEQIPMLDVKASTLKHYYTLEGRLMEWGVMQTWSDVTVENICRFDAWLHQQRKPISETARLAGVVADKISDAGIYNYHKNLKALLYRADRFGKIPRNPYEQLRGMFKRGEKESIEFLTEDEMRRIQALQLPRGSVLDIARDLFLFQTFTGLSYSDAIAFDFSKYRLIEGRWTHIGQRIKTGVAYISELLPPVVEILQKYQGRVPKIDNADYNHRLKEIGSMAGIAIRMHSHLGRHTFATYMLANGVRIEVLRKMLGHKSILQTQRYAKVLPDTVKEEMEKVRSRWEGKSTRENREEH